MKLYENLANQLEESIHSGALQPGDRLPSVRRTSSSRGVSPATVFQAYYLLEARGLIRARERSGYFVAPGKGAVPQAQTPSAPSEECVELDVADRVFTLLDSVMKRHIVPFGSPIPSPTLFPLQSLGKSMAIAARTLSPWATVDEMSPGKQVLRRLIAARYAVDGITVRLEEIVITSGALEALNLSLAAITRPGDAVVVESPTFYAALQAIQRLGLRAVEVSMHPHGGLDLAALARAISRHQPKACWLMPTFQNPLGCTMPEDRKRELVALLALHRVPLIEDDVYGELYFGARRPLPAKAFDREGLVLHCSSYSKTLAPGYRIGWTAAGVHADAVVRLKLSTTLATSAPGQLGLARYLAGGGYDRHLRKMREQLARQYATAAQAVARHFPAGTHATRPEGGYMFWVVLPEGTDAVELHRRALAQRVSVAPGPMFSPSGQFANCIRINFGHPMDARAERALEQLGKLASQLVPT
jgi:DNA-binding transcriptional MocR family regulator